MGKIIKRLGMLLCILFMAITICQTKTIAADNSDERFALLVNAPEDWKDIHVWAWSTAGDNVFAAWPGESMDALEDNEGWYYIWLPVWADHAKLTANDEAVEAELQLEGKNSWVTVKGNNDTLISTEELTTGEIPAYVEKYPVHIKVDATWIAPVIETEDGSVVAELEEGENGWYEGKLPVDVKKLSVATEEGEKKTDIFRVDAAEIWITVEADGKFDYSYKDPDAEEVPNITVHAQIPADWENPNLWAWSAPDGTNAFASWPGEALEENDGWYVKEVPGWINSIIVNGNKGKVQTADISVETGKDIWLIVTDSDNYELSYENPEGPAEVETTTEEIKETDNVTTAATETEAPTTVADNKADKNEAKKSALPIIIIVGVVAVIAIIVVVTNKKK